MSMLPTLRSGDRLLVDREAYRSSGPTIGDLVVAPDPTAPDRLLIKRVAAIGPAHVWATSDGFEPRPSASSVPPSNALEEIDLLEGQLLLSSDRPRGARDSRHFGAVPVDGLLGAAWYRYSPRDRRGVL